MKKVLYAKIYRAYKMPLSYAERKDKYSDVNTKESARHRVIVKRWRYEYNQIITI